MRKAFATKDPSFDGTFVVAVKTTSIFCRPTCRARPPKPQNVEFFASAEQAMRQGYRPCKLCRPLENGHAPPPVVMRLMELVDARMLEPVTGSDLREAKIDPSTARRRFRQYCGLTFAAYQRSRRLGAAMRELQAGKHVIDAQLGAGFASGSGFRKALARVFGATTSKASQAVSTLAADWFETPLGRMLAIAHDDGIVLLDFVDRRGLERAILRLRRRLGAGRGRLAAVAPGPHPHLQILKQQLREYFEGRRQGFDVKLSPHGTPFQMRAWEYLRQIPFGQTRSYAQQAEQMGSPRAVRAVGAANGMNYLSIIIPCHRVVGSNGELTGYGGGLARKRWLLDHERRSKSQGKDPGPRIDTNRHE